MHFDKRNTGKKLEKAFFLNATEDVAMKLLGKIIVKIDESGETIAGKVVETEAYLHDTDKASHSYKGMTERNKPMFEQGGILYVYKSYGIHHCINVVTEEKGKGAAVLIRAVEPVSGIGIMQNRRGVDDIRRLCKGPGNTAKAFGFTLNDNYRSVTSEKLYFVAHENIPEKHIIITKRIGISQSKDLLLRFYVKNSNFISRK
jgi:DNA-3-methyladenine glycosylase